MKKIGLIMTFIYSFILLIGQNANYHWFEKDGKLYYNKNTPAYFWISTSPTDTTQDVLLTSQRSKKYINPMYFDSDGYNTFRSVSTIDTTTNYTKQAIFKIYVDGLPPVPNAYFMGTRKYYSRGKSVYGPGLKIKLSAVDYNSGLDKIMYSINNNNYTVYTTPVEFLIEGEYSFSYYSIDNTGNANNIKTYNFIVKK
ncbi:MAG: hypothetical protein JXR68_10715 [Bacteroidales bacterium]|nr:hypothetical protein [Bacteroidales bacterium]